MKILKIAQENPFRNEGVDPLESPMREQFEAEQDFLKNNTDEDSEVSQYIDQLKDKLYSIKTHLTIVEEEYEHSLKTQNWDYFKRHGIIK